MRFFVIGAAGYAEEVAWSVREQEIAAGRPCEFAFFDDARPKGPLQSGLGAVEGTLADVARARSTNDVCLVLGVGLPRTKAAVVERLTPLGLPWATVVHPSATIGPNVSIGEGSYVGAGSVLTVNVRIGRFATINLHCQVAHGNVLGEFVTLHPDTHLSGDVRIGEGAELGTGTIVLPGTTIGPWAVVGAGAVAVRPLTGGKTYVGIPARELEHDGRMRHANQVTAARSGSGSPR